MKIQLTSMPNEIEILMPKELQTKEFADEYLVIQNLYSNLCSKVTIRFENTLWIDNLAMIQLFLMLYKLKQLGKKIHFDFVVDSDEVEQVRFIKYMNDYGYFDVIKFLSEDFSDKNLIDLDYTNLSAGNFESSECFMPFTIISKRDEISDYIEKVKNEFQEKFAQYFSEYEKDNLIFRMSIFLQETISNVFEHAFDDTEAAFCGVMIRNIHKSNVAYRKQRTYYSLRDNSDASIPFREGKFTYGNYLMLAKNHNPYRSKSGIDILENYVQIFVADIGMGLLESMSISDPGVERNLINEIFKKGMRSSKKARNTSVGGLGMLYQLLQEKENYISIKGEYNWAQIACTDKKDNSKTLDYTHKSGIISRNVLKGFTVVGYIDCNYKSQTEFFVSLPKGYVDKIYKEVYILTDMEEISYVDVLDLRSSIPDLSKIEIHNNAILCFVGANLDKEILSNKIMFLFNFSVKARKTLILADIPKQELRKYELIFKDFTTKVDKVILLGQNLEFAVLTNKNQTSKIYYDEDETNKYRDCKEDDITQSLCELLRTIRKYDSQKFWSIVSNTQMSKAAQLYINENVVWDLDKDTEMNGYLDFSQTYFDEEIKSLLLYQLFRLPGCDNNEKYFESMDRFTEDICENVNNKLNVSFVEKEPSYIQLGSIYVTGTSSKTSKLEANEKNKNEYYYFVHSISPLDDENRISALLLWPSEKIVNELFEKIDSAVKYERLSKTPFLAPQGTTYFARQHYANIGDSIELKQDDLYSIFQKEYLWTSRLVKIAHVDMIDHHDFIYLNAVAIFNKHYSESAFTKKYVAKNSFDYLLKNMYIALGKSKEKSFEKTIEMDIQPEYRAVVKGKIQEDMLPQTAGLFIYLADYETMEIVSKLKVIFSEGMQRYIIPIAPVSKKKGSAALLVSPVLMENIKEKLHVIEEINPDNETRVTIFIATVTSTKLQRELKHILYRLGAKKIKCLSLIDRQRFPLGSRERESYNSYCKIDLPQLGSENRCKLCFGIHQIEELKIKLVSSEMQKRCEEIISIWGKAKASDNLYARGIQAHTCVIPLEIEKNIKEICARYQISEITITTDVGLVLFAIENAAITMSVNFLMSCLENSEIDDSVKIMMISAHLILFGSDEIVPADILYLAESLYNLIQCQKKADEYTALACIVILLQKDNIKERLYEYYEEHWQWQYFNNIDFIITSVGLLNTMPEKIQDRVLNYWIKKSMERHIDYLYGIFLLTDGNDITRHQTILAKMRDATYKFSQMDCLSASNDVAFLKIAYQTIPHSYFDISDNYKDKRKKVIDKIEDVELLLKSALDEDTGDSNKISISEEVVNMFHCAQSLNNELFMNSGENGLRTLRKKLQSIAEKVLKENSNVKCYVKVIQYNEEYGKKYFYYIEDLQREIFYLMLDFRHADSNNLMIGEDKGRYSGILEIKFEEHCMKYCFTNHVTKNFKVEAVKKKKELKYNRPTILNLQMLLTKEGKNQLFNYKHDADDNTFTVELSIPYLNI